MKTLLSIILLGASLYSTLAVGEPSFEVTPAKEYFPLLVGPGKILVERTFTFKNTSGIDLYMSGYSTDHLLFNIHTHDVRTGKWAKLNEMICGTGLESHLIKNGDSFPASVMLPLGISAREFKISFNCRSSRDGNKHWTITKGPFLLTTVLKPQE